MLFDELWVELVFISVDLVVFVVLALEALALFADVLAIAVWLCWDGGADGFGWVSL